MTVHRPPLSTDEQARELAATLVRMARADRPSRGAYHRVLGAVAKAGVAGGFLAGSSASAGVAVSSKSGLSAFALSVAKWTAVGAIGSALVVGAPRVVAHVPMLQARAVVRVAESPKRRAVVDVPHEVARPPSTSTPAPAPVPVPVFALPPEPPLMHPLPAARNANAPPVAQSAARATPDVLLSEVAELDKARSLLAARAPDRALATLDTYVERFPNGNLRLEAAALRIEALAKSGRAAPALALGRQFLAAHAHTPLAYRVREILDSLGSSKD
jgi:hypothetical protein